MTKIKFIELKQDIQKYIMVDTNEKQKKIGIKYSM